MSIEGKVAIITGASSGIGYATALALSKAGVKVAIGARRTDKLKQLENEIKKNGGDSTAFSVDVSDADKVTFMVASVLKDFGKIDILINNAGYPLKNEYWNSSFESLNIDDYQHVLDVDLLGSIRCCMQIIPIMKKQKNGNIVNISSTPAIAGYDKGIPYTIAKSGLLGLTKHLALEYGKFNIRVNSLALGNINSSSTFDQLDKIEQEKLGNESSLRRWGEPEEVAKTCLMLVSDNFSFVTGQTIIIDGGTVMF